MLGANITLYFSKLFQEGISFVFQSTWLQLPWNLVWQTLYYEDVKDYYWDTRRPFKIQNLQAKRIYFTLIIISASEKNYQFKEPASYPGTKNIRYQSYNKKKRDA